jgi:hypothetical protein
MYEHDSLYTKKATNRTHDHHDNFHDGGGKGCAVYSLIGLIVIIVLTCKAIF